MQRKSQLLTEKEYPELEEYHKLCKLISGEQEKCHNELSAGLSAIIHLEALPGPLKADGTKFVSLYKTLQDLMKGYPVEELDDMTRSVLAEADAELMTELQSPKGLEDFKKLQSYLASGCYDTSNSGGDQFKTLHEIMGDPQWNPLNLPSEFLFNKSQDKA